MMSFPAVPGFCKPKIVNPKTGFRARSRLLLLRLLLLTSLLILTTQAPGWAAESVKPAFGFHPQALLQTALQWIQGLGAWGAIAFIGLYILATITFFPGWILTLGAGVLFGVVAGSIYVAVGATLGAIAAFTIGRYLARKWITQKIAAYPKFQAIDAAVSRNGFKIVLLTRLSPVFPFNFLNYAYGLTGVSFRDFCLGSVGMIPGTIAYVYLGSLAGSLATLGITPQTGFSTTQWGIRLLGLIATLAVTISVTRIAQQALESDLSASPGNQPQVSDSD